MISVSGAAPVLVEIDGQQHFRPIGFLGGITGHEMSQESDAIKEQFCADSNIPLIRIEVDYINKKGSLWKEALLAAVNRALQEAIPKQCIGLSYIANA